MNDEFVEQCRREWKRLGVRRAVADDMAAELAADLEEGASPGDVLGSDAGDARAFAAAWAKERGVIPARGRNARVIVPLLAVALALTTLAGVVLMSTSSSPSHEAGRFVRIAPLIAKPTPQRVWVGPPLHAISMTMPPVTEPGLLRPAKVLVEPNTHTRSDWTNVGLALALAGGIGLIALVATRLWGLRHLAFNG